MALPSPHDNDLFLEIALPWDTKQFPPLFVRLLLSTMRTSPLNTLLVAFGGKPSFRDHYLFGTEVENPESDSKRRLFYGLHSKFETKILFISVKIWKINLLKKVRLFSKSKCLLFGYF